MTDITQPVCEAAGNESYGACSLHTMSPWTASLLSPQGKQAAPPPTCPASVFSLHHFPRSIRHLSWRAGSNLTSMARWWRILWTSARHSLESCMRNKKQNTDQTTQDIENLSSENWCNFTVIWTKLCISSLPKEKVNVLGGFYTPLPLGIWCYIQHFLKYCMKYSPFLRGSW